MDLDTRALELLEIIEVISEGGIPSFRQNELFTAGSFDILFFNSNDKNILFNFLGLLCSKYSQIKTERSAKYISSFLWCLEILCRSTDTTQMPLGMQEIIDDNTSNRTAISLANWYRID
jgi:hypothetical protein